jgi:hypothetical protein
MRSNPDVPPARTTDVRGTNYSLTSPDGLASRIAARARVRMFEAFMSTFQPTAEDRVLDIGVTSDQAFTSSNYFEALYPYKDRVVASGVDDGARFLEERYPGMGFVVADGCDLPFEDDSFDFVHSSAVLEHVGSRERQARMLAESTRVARKGVWHTTPNRWYPVELHTQLPFVHWLPAVRFRALLRVLGHAELAREENLNLMTTRDLETACTPISSWHFTIRGHRLLGLSSNLLLAGWPDPPGPGPQRPAGGRHAGAG